VRARRRGWAAVLLAGVTGVAGLGPVLLVTAEPAWAFMAPVKIIERGDNDFEFNPRTTQIEVGDGVTWVNGTDRKHTVTSDPGKDSFDSDEISANDGQGADPHYERRFNSPGTYVYRCKIHPKMTGVVEVRDPAATTTTTAPTTTTSAPTTTTTAPTTTTTEPPTTTSTALRPPAAAESPPVPATAAAPPPTLASSSTTTVPSSTSTTVPPTTATTGTPPPTQEQAAPPTTPSSQDPTTSSTGDEISTAIGPAGRDGGADPATVTLVSALVAVGLFGAWTLIRVRPGRV
jgi:plastocyanin